MPIVSGNGNGVPGADGLYSGRLGGPISALGIFALGIGDSAHGLAASSNPWVQGLKMSPRNFSKTTYNRFFTYLTTPRQFTFQVNRLDRANIDTSRDYTEIGSGETVLWKFDFTNVLLPGETVQGQPTVKIDLKRQNIVVPVTIISVTYSGAVVSVTISANGAVNPAGFGSMLGVAAAQPGLFMLGGPTQGSAISGLKINGSYSLICSIPLSSSRVESTILDFNVPI